MGPARKPRPRRGSSTRGPRGTAAGYKTNGGESVTSQSDSIKPAGPSPRSLLHSIPPHESPVRQLRQRRPASGGAGAGDTPPTGFTSLLVALHQDRRNWGVRCGRDRSASRLACMQVAYKVVLSVHVTCIRSRSGRPVASPPHGAGSVSANTGPARTPDIRSFLRRVATQVGLLMIAAHTHPSRKITTAVSCEQSVDGIIVENARMASLRVAPRPLARSHTQCALGSPTVRGVGAAWWPSQQPQAPRLR